MSLKSRLNKLIGTKKLRSEKVYFIGWASCTWSHSEGFTRDAGESKADFCKRVYLATKKQYLWFD